MAVTKVTKIRGDDAVKDASGKRLTDRYLVYCESADTPLVAFGAADPDTGLTVPDVGDAHAVDPTMTAQSVAPTRWADENNPCFLVVVPFSTSATSVEKKPPGEGVKWNKNVSGSGEEVVEDVNTNVAGNPIKNSAGDNIARSIPDVKYDSVITVTYNTDDPSNFVLMENSRGRINSDEVTLTIERFGAVYERTFPPYTLKLGNVTWNIDVGPDGEGFFNVTIPLLYRNQLDKDGNQIGWKVQIPDVGYRYYIEGTDEKVVSQGGVLVNLDGNGELAEDGALQEVIVEQTIYDVPFMDFLEGI